MKIIANDICHIYNQGNNKELLFYTDEDYLRFLILFRKLVLPYCKVLAYCLMPNHFHFLIYTNDYSAATSRLGNIETTNLSNAFRSLLTSYTRYLNKQQDRTGSRFRQKTKKRSMIEGTNSYAFVAFQYIHQNPVKAGLVEKMEDWPYSSYRDFAGFRCGTLCDMTLAAQLIGFNTFRFREESAQMIEEAMEQKIFAKGKTAPIV